MKRFLIPLICLVAAGMAAAAPEARPVGEVAHAWAERFHADLLAEPGIEALPVSAATANSVERSLDGLQRTTPSLRWIRWHAPEGVEAAEIGNLARAQSRIGIAWMAVERPNGPVLRVFHETENRTTPSRFLIYSADEEAGRTPADRVADLQRQQTDLANDGDAASAYGGMIGLLRQMPPGDAEKFARATVAAGDRVWDATPPEQRNQLFSDTKDLMTCVIEAARNGPAPPMGATPTAGFTAEFLSAARALAGEEQVTILVDPGVFAPNRVRFPERGQDLQERLTALSKGQPAIVWRRVFVRDKDLYRLKKTGATAAFVQGVRSLDALQAPEAELQDPFAGRQVRFEIRKPANGKKPSETLPEEVKPLYLLLNAAPSAHGRSREERLLDLQRQQVSLMLRMTPDQMASAMGPLVRNYGAASPDERRRLIGLPLMAGLMAGWLPRRAKENAGQ
jgi:hypothetical protein